MDEEYIDPLWHLSDLLTLQIAASLIAGYDPNEVSICRNDTNFDRNYSRLYPVEEALRNAVLSGALDAKKVATGHYTHVRYVDGESEGYWDAVDQISLSGTTVKVADLRNWLASRGFKTGFFFPDGVDVPDFLDHNHKSYSPKLAAAIEAWLAVNAAPEMIKGTVKQALQIWLRKNADRFGLTKEDGSPNEQGIEEVAKVANWDTKGGAPKTPG